MKKDKAISHSLTGLSFGIYSKDELLKMSVVEINKPASINELGIPVDFGVYDPHLGPITMGDGKCKTCSLIKRECPGHFGHINLPFPIYNPVTFDTLFIIMRAICFNCHHFRISKKKIKLAINALRCANAGKLSEASDFVDYLEVPESGLASMHKYKNRQTMGKGKKKSKATSITEWVTLPDNPNLDDENDDVIRIAPSKNQQEMRQYILKVLFKVMKDNKTCQKCEAKSLKISKDGKKKFFQHRLPDKDAKAMKGKKIFYIPPGGKDEDDPISNWILGTGNEKVVLESSNKRYIRPKEIFDHFKKVWENETDLVSLIWSGICKNENLKTRDTTADVFFLERLPVTPSRFRPLAMHGGVFAEHPQNLFYLEILQFVEDLEKLGDDENDDNIVESFSKIEVEIQNLANMLMDNEPNNNSQHPTGIKQILEKKTGIFRHNMMGKRVNFACRSVISPDLNIATNEIGLPIYFAKNLTFPESVTPQNVERLRQAIINGPDVYPGALSVEDDRGLITSLQGLEIHKRRGIAASLTRPIQDDNLNSIPYGKIVNRHLLNGDLSLVNRQPTLHKPSIMAHKVRVIGTQKTILMHYSNCNTYNADFDGDEMNVHIPQNYIAKAEALEIALADTQYTVPKDGSPLRGLIQDHVCSGVLMSSQDAFFTKEEILQISYQAISVFDQTKIDLSVPAILRPVQLWTGKQVFSIVLNHLLKGKEPFSFEGDSKIPAKYWGEGSLDHRVIIHNNVLLTGIVGKNHFGNKEHGLVHSLHELYGGEISGKILSGLGRLLTFHLQMRGLTCGIEDMLLLEPENNTRQDIIDRVESVGIEQAAVFCEVESESEEAVKDALKEKISDPRHLENWDSHMISQLGKKTTEVIGNCIVGLRKPFPLNNLSLMTTSGAKGSQVNFAQISCLLGQQELEGKRVPLMSTGKSLPCFQPYDPSPRANGYVADRFLTGIRPPEYYFHCMAGREGLVDTAVKTSRSGYLQRCIIKHLEGLMVAYDYTVRDSDQSIIQFQYGEDGIDVGGSSFLTEFQFAKANMAVFNAKLKPEYASTKLKEVPKKTLKKYSRNLEKERNIDDLPLMNIYSPGMTIGSVSEKFEKELTDFVKKNFSRKKEAKKFKKLMYLKYINGLANPGENIGTLAGQSIGEPSTQMTLNTFHLAGRGDLNVTLGVPRLRELIMNTNSSPATPTMTLPLKEEFGKNTADEIALKFKRVNLDSLLSQVDVKDTLKIDEDSGMLVREFEINLEVGSYKKFNLQWKRVRRVLEDVFLPRLLNRVGQVFKRKKLQKKLESNTEENFLFELGEELTVPKNKKIAKEQLMEDFGTDASKSFKRQNQKGSYDSDDSDVEMAEENSVDEERNKDNSEDSYESGKYLGSTDMLTYYTLEKKDKMNIVLNTPTTDKVLILSIIQKTAAEVFVREVPNIVRCAVLDIKGEISLQTEGVNFKEMWKLKDILDINTISSNDLTKIYETYGVEAARAAFIDEVGGVFAVYGIGVSRRHLSLIADYVTFEGGLTPLNRIGLKSNPSPFLKMSFETTMQFLKTSIIEGDHEPLLSPSSQIVLGIPPTTGTGSFDVLHDLNFEQ